MAQGTCSVEGCNRVNRSRGWCNMHYLRWRKYGNPTTFLLAYTSRLGDLEAAAVAVTNDCILLRDRMGEPLPVRFRGTTMVASRAVWIIAHGDPSPLHVLHTCNGGSGSHGCINIRHLRLGTPLANSRDMVRAGRSTRGNSNPQAKLTEPQVLAIREASSRLTPTELSKRYGVSRSAVKLILDRKTWRHI